MQFRVLRYFRLDKQRRLRRIDTRGQPVNHHVPGMLFDLLGAVVMRCQGMPVGDKKETLVLVLETNPVFQYAVVMPEMQRPGRTHA